MKVMKNEEFTVSEELEQMRKDYAQLKARLERQEITNEKLIRETIRKSLRMVNDKKWVSLAAGIMAVPLIAALSMHLGLRPAFTIISIVWIVGMVAGNLIRNRNLSLDSTSGESVRDFVDEIKRRKDSQFRWVRVNFSIFVLWAAYFAAECFRTGMSREMLIPIVAGMAVGMVLGLVIGLRMHNRIIGAYEGIILELENPDAAEAVRR